MEIEKEKQYRSEYADYYGELEKKYSALIGDNLKVPINWCTKIWKKNSLIESEGRCGGGETRSPNFMEYLPFARGWQGVTFYIDRCVGYDYWQSFASPVNVAILMEPRHFREPYYQYLLDGGHKLYSMILTHDAEILKRLPKKAVYCIAGAPIIESSSIGMHLKNKNKLISTCYSDKGSSEFLSSALLSGQKQRATEGHLFRHKIARSIPEFGLDYDVDLYGSGSPSGPLKLKSDSLVNHMFSIVVENGNSEMYFTEKIMDCFLTGNIPIYRGASKIGDFFDKRGIIEFNTIEELEHILKNKVNIDTYNEMLPYMKKNLEITKQYMYIDDIMLFLTLDFMDKKWDISFDYLKSIDFGSKNIRIEVKK